MNDDQDLLHGGLGTSSSKRTAGLSTRRPGWEELALEEQRIKVHLPAKDCQDADALTLSAVEDQISTMDHPANTGATADRQTDMGRFQ
jgi:hypothetical protein